MMDLNADRSGSNGVRVNARDLCDDATGGVTDDETRRRTFGDPFDCVGMAEERRRQGGGYR